MQAYNILIMWMHFKIFLFNDTLNTFLWTVILQLEIILLDEQLNAGI